MDIASLAIAMSQMDLATKVSTSVTKMAMNDGVEAATQITNMISEVSDPNLGNIIDTRI
ncbi:YjfB family protein [uncultured Clostridium sp.]|uniref:YjfB family protein n=1 Tax=uncultured Clostridium sp. TaxID=59620 RepID=UPI0025DB1544|nr:YjfB family protein [uncultured Clostridium sp.]